MLTEIEKAKIRDHLGYPNVAPAGAISLGIPSLSQPLFILESGMRTVLPEAVELARRYVLECDCTLEQLSKARTRLKAEKIDELTTRKDELSELEGQYDFWRMKLAGVFGAVINPFEPARAGVEVRVQSE